MKRLIFGSRYEMKFTNKLFIGLILTATSMAGFAQKNPEDQLSQQFSVSQDVIKQLISDLWSKDDANTLRVSDYRIWKKSFDASTENALTEYEKKIETNVYGPLKEVVGTYNKILNNNSIRVDQKKQLLESVFIQINHLVPQVQKEFHMALKELYAKNDLLPHKLYARKKNFQKQYSVDPTFYSSNGQERPVKSDLNFQDAMTHYCKYTVQTVVEDEAISWVGALSGNKGRYCGSDRELPRIASVRNAVEGEDTALPYFLTHKFSYEFTHQRIIDGCETKGCILLKTSDLTFYFDSIYRMLDQDIVISLDDGTKKQRSVTIKSLHLPSLQYWLNLINRKDVPESIEKLPFDI